MAGKPIKRPKSRKKKKTKAAVTTRSTAGPGFDFEDHIGAYLLLQMLMGEALPGSSNAIGSRLQTQTKALGWAIDDLLVTSERTAETRHQLAVSCKSNTQVSGSGLPKDFVLAAWDQWSRSDKGPMKRDRDSLMLATRGRHDAFDKLWADIKLWSTGDPATALARIDETARHKKVFANIKGPIKKQNRGVRDEDLIAFIRHLVVMPTDFHLADSEHRRQAIGRLRGLLRGRAPSQGEKLWDALVASVRSARLGGGTVERATLIESLARQFDLNDAPNYEPSWRALVSATATYKSNIDSALPNAFQIDRQSEIDELSALLARESVAVLHGEAGSGKSALLKATLDNRFADWRQVWLGPDQLSVMLSDVERAKLGLAHPLADVLRASSKPNNVLVIDSAERLTRQVQAGARDLVTAVTSGASPWHVILIGQTEAWTEGTLQTIANRTDPPNHEVKLIPAEDVQAALRSTNGLGWASTHDEIVAVLRNLRTLAWVLEAESRFRPQDAEALASYQAIADRLWQYWTGRKVKLQNLLIRLGEREANFEHSFAVSELDPTDAAALDDRPPQTPVRINGRNRIEFQHDLAAEWARFQRLKEIADHPEQCASYAAHPLWLGALRMLGGFLLREKVGDRSAWDVALEKLESQQATAAADILLDALCLDPLAETFLTARVDLLLKDHGRLLNRLLARFQHIATAPSGVTDPLDPTYALYFESQFRFPIVARWPPTARFLHRHRERIAQLTSPPVAQLCAKWLTALPATFSGEALPLRREFADVALAAARALQLATKKKEIIFVGDFGKAIYPAALAAATDLPDAVSVWALEMAQRRPLNADLKAQIAEHRRRKAEEHQEKLRTDPAYRKKFQRREHFPTSIPSGRKLPPWPLGPAGHVDQEFAECCTNSGGLMPLMKVRPDVAAEVLLATLIEGSPEEQYGTSRFDEGFGLQFDRESYPTAYWKSPFFSFLQINRETALVTLIKLVNFCTGRWAAEWRKAFSGSPPSVILHLPDGERAFLGDTMMFCWSQSNSMHAGQLNSSLAALERYLTMALDAGVDIEPVLQQILLTGASAAFLGVLSNIGKYRPQLFKDIFRPLVTNRRIYEWDDERLKALPYAFVAQWAQQGEFVFNMARDWHHAPYRQKSMREVVKDVARSDAGFAAHVNDATAQWQLPSDRKRALEIRILAAQLDSRNYTSGADGAEEFTWPQDLASDVQAFQNEKASVLQILQLPARCLQFLGSDASLNEQSAERLTAMLDTIEAETELEEEFKAQARIAAAAALLARGSAWLDAHQAIRQRCQTILDAVLNAIPDTIDELRASRLERAGILQFVAHAVFARWIETGTAEAQTTLLKIITSGDAAAVRTIFDLAHARRSQLRERWRRLLFLGLLWSALWMLTPRYGDRPDEEVRWCRWLARFRNLPIDGVATDAEQIDPLGIAQRLEKLERGRWRREFERRDGWRGPPPDECRTAGLAWDFLEAALGWLFWESDQPNPLWSDAAEFQSQRELILRLWAFETWLNHRPRPDHDDDPVPSQLAHKVIQTIVKMIAKAPAEDARPLWEPVLSLGAAGHYSVGHFISCWFFEAYRLDPIEFAALWRLMIEYALAAPEWAGGKPWYYGQQLLRQMLGFGSTAILDHNAAFQDIAQQMSDYYERWARENLAREEDNITALSLFLASATGRPLRLNALRWLQEAVTPESSWYRAAMGNALLELLNVMLIQDLDALRADSGARDAFLALTALLVTKQVPAALALQERARRSF
jgi:hypothetical protein